MVRGQGFPKRRPERAGNDWSPTSTRPVVRQFGNLRGIKTRRGPPTTNRRKCRLKARNRCFTGHSWTETTANPMSPHPMDRRSSQTARQVEPVVSTSSTSKIFSPFDSFPRALARNGFCRLRRRLKGPLTRLGPPRWRMGRRIGRLVSRATCRASTSA